MKRDEWLHEIQSQTEALYDQLAPAYWVRFGLYANETHRQFVEKFLHHLSPRGFILDAACGAGRYDGMLLEAGHSVLGIDQSGRMLARAREVFPEERFPEVRYEQLRLREIEFQMEFDGIICIDALEHVFPEDWPEILVRFERALKPAGVLYFTVEVAERDDVAEAYERAKALGLPVVFGEVAETVDTANAELAGPNWQAISGSQAGLAAYHYYPSLDQVRTWLEQAGLTVEEQESGDGYEHFLVRKNA